MLQLIKFKENGNNSKKDKKFFKLTFADDELIDQAWPFLETCLKSYKPYEDLKVRAEVIIRTNGNFINLYFNNLKSNMDISDQELEEELEKVKTDYENYWKQDD
jgi:hypothetical protein